MPIPSDMIEAIADDEGGGGGEESSSSSREHRDSAGIVT